MIYVDELFLLSLLVDYLLCLMTARFCGLVLRRARYLLAALLGAVYAVLVFLPGLQWAAQPAVSLCAAAGMGLVAFGGERRLLRCCAAFLAVSASLGGLVWAIALRAGSMRPPDGRLLLGGFALSYLLLTLLSRTRQRRARESQVTVELRLGQAHSVFRALLDSGNCLRDPLTQAPVMLVSPAVLRPLFPGLEALLDERDPVALVELAGALPETRGRFRLLRCTSVGGQSLLPVFRPDEALVDGQARKELLAAVSPAAHGDGFEGVL
ncbi:MAG: sigma-E processing peptidase SpoIIGA [Oscillospiraceae bacterium]|nr:sigma-E processing peptidase SpoIIGA [Oscillospiraceae bacterium]